MLVGKSQSLDLQEVRLSQQSIDVDTESVRCELGIEPGAKPSKRVSMIGLNIQLLGELSIDGLNNLAD